MRFLSLLLVLILSACASTSPFMVVAANPHAVEAGMAVLRDGGDATDAAIAVAATLTLVEPQSSGLGGGGFMLRYDGKTGAVTAYDGREVAPAAAAPDQFLNSDGSEKPFLAASRTGQAIGVPGLVAMLEAAHKDHGKKTWAETVAGAQKLATGGFAISPRMARLLTTPGLEQSWWLKRLYFNAEGKPLAAGTILKNPAYADVLRRLGVDGPKSFYTGSIAKTIVAVSRAAPDGGAMTAEDMAGYKAQTSTALCRPYRIYTICVPPLPSGGVGLLQIMGILEHTDIATRGPYDSLAWHTFAEANRLMLADRAMYFADPAYVEDASRELLDRDYLKSRAALISPKAMPVPKAGELRMGLAGDPAFPTTGTSHFVIIDRDGDVISTTQSVEYLFGSNRTAGGMVLNNQLTDFSFAPERDGKPVANRLTGGKRPRSSMAPVIVLNAKGKPVMAIGSPGGAAIPAYIAKTLVAVLDWNLTLQAAMDLPNLVARPDGLGGETDVLPAAVVDGLKARGHTLIAPSGEDSGLHGVLFTRDGPVGAADKRREGVAGVE